MRVCKKKLSSSEPFLVLVFILLLSIPLHAATVMLGDFEGSMDGWSPDSSGVTTAYSAEGLTYGVGSLQVSFPSGWVGVLEKSMASQLDLLQTMTSISMNITTRNDGAQIPGWLMLQAHQKWTIMPVPDAGGYLGGPYFKITVAGTDRTLAATKNAELEAVPVLTGTPEQLWRIDQLTDGTYRIMPKSIPSYAITAVGVTTPSLTRLDPESDRGRWNLKSP